MFERMCDDSLSVCLIVFQADRQTGGVSCLYSEDSESRGVLPGQQPRQPRTKHSGKVQMFTNMGNGWRLFHVSIWKEPIENSRKGKALKKELEKHLDKLSVTFKADGFLYCQWSQLVTVSLHRGNHDELQCLTKFF